jgi:hypothetical protein
MIPMMKAIKMKMMMIFTSMLTILPSLSGGTLLRLEFYHGISSGRKTNTLTGY